jgi:hypothetical protein
MKIFLRIFLTFFVFIAVDLFVFWGPFSLIRAKSGMPMDSSIPEYVSLLLAIIVAYFTWKKSGNLTNGLVSHILMGGLIIGGISFCTGFFGPIIFDPGANQGPLLGIFITGPVGFVVGLIAGGIFWVIKREKSKPQLLK